MKIRYKIECYVLNKHLKTLLINPVKEIGHLVDMIEERHKCGTIFDHVADISTLILCKKHAYKAYKDYDDEDKGLTVERCNSLDLYDEVRDGKLIGFFDPLLKGIMRSRR